MFRTERQRQLLSHLAAEIEYIITDKCWNNDLSDEEMAYIYATIAQNLTNNLMRWTFEDLKGE